MKFRKAKGRKNSTAGVHKYIVVTHHETKDVKDSAYYYCKTLKEARARRQKAQPGDIIEIFKATHTFHEAWERIA